MVDSSDVPTVSNDCESARNLLVAASCSPSGRGYLLGVARLVVAGAGQGSADPNMIHISVHMHGHLQLYHYLCIDI